MKLKIGTCLMFIILLFACRKPEEWNAEENNEWYAGGKQTVWETGNGAFSQMFPVISGENAHLHEIGDIAFEATFVSSGTLNPGLGPIYNSVACTSCHINDGRGTPIGPGTQVVSLLFRLSITGQDAHGGPLPVPNYGGQLQQNSIFGAEPEAHIEITYDEINGNYSDGSTYSLRNPNYFFTNFYAPIPEDYHYSPRIAPPVFGLGLLEAISENDITDQEDPMDVDGNGISGKANYVWDVLNQTTTLGRFGWKAGQPSVLQQTAGAYNEDMGITSFIFPTESAHGQSQLQTSSNNPELSDSLLFAASHYVSTLAVPARRNADDENVQQGKKIFYELKCNACHTPMFQTKVDVVFREVSNQYIFPYTDLLLHDMGEGLADNRDDFLANGYEWRTPPLWGIGLTSVVNGHQNFLHDGRARTLEEAILWHGGEAQFSQSQFISLSQIERSNLISFLKSL